MIITKHKAIFMHIGKTGGTSIEDAFGRKLTDGSQKCVALWGGKHWRPTKFKEERPDEWESFYKFSFVRNPWDRMVSIFFFRRDFRKIIPATMEFEEFVKTLDPKRPNNWEQITWFQGCLEEFDFIGRYENLQKDYEHVCSQIGAEPKTLPHIYKTDHEHYTEYYTDELRDLVEDAFPIDIKTFGYEFE